MDDREIVARQLGRAPRAFLRVARRCPFGLPAVTEQAPYDDDDEPFPTTYYLTCPHLVAAVSRLEAGGGVERWSEAAVREPALAASLARATAEQRRVRRRLARGRSGKDGGASLDLGIAGAGRAGSLKCLHAHAAFALARTGYELGERIVEELEPLWPDRCCSDGLVSRDGISEQSANFSEHATSLPGPKGPARSLAGRAALSSLEERPERSGRSSGVVPPGSFL